MDELNSFIGEIETSLAETDTPPERLRELLDGCLEVLKCIKDKKDPGKDETPYDAIVGIYHVQCGTLARVSKLTPLRKKHIRARWNEEGQNTLAFWQQFFKRVAASDFLTGRSASDRSWRPNIDWFMNPANMVKVLEGQYDNRKPMNSAERRQNQTLDDAVFESSRRLAR